MKANLEVINLKAYYFLPSATIKAVDGVTFTIENGEALGMIGESGSGKSTIASSIMRYLRYPGKIVDGEIFYKGQNILELNNDEMRILRWKNISIITQSSLNALDPLMKVGEQIIEAIMVNENVNYNDANKRANKLFKDVGLDISRFKNYSHELSGGMRQRVMIAMALACRPGLIIADEPTTALDVIIQAQILNLLDELLESMESSSIMFITHDLSVIVELCHKIAIMYGGKMMEYANTKKIINNPLNPYTKGLLKSFPHIEERKMIFESIPGNPPNMMNLPKGCIFHPRCQYAKNICLKEFPKMVKMDTNHHVACHLY